MSVPCPLCRHHTTWENNPWRPFCSARCQLIDLGTWASEKYRIPEATPTEREMNGEINGGVHGMASDTADSDESL